MTTSFVSEFARRLQGQSPALALPLTWIEQQLSESGLTIERLVQLGNQQLAADQLSISNSIDSLRFLDAMDWQEFVETMSVVEQTLRHDPGGVYSRMDFATRDQYRHIIEEIARKSPLSEVEVARRAIILAQQSAAGKGDNDRTAHVGFYLIDKGLPQLERLARVRFSVFRALRKVSGRFPLLLYTGSILLMTMIFAWGLLAKVYAGGVTWLGTLAYGYTPASMRKSSGCCPGELAGDINGNTKTSAANGLLAWDSTRIAHPCGYSDHAHELSEYRGTDRSAGSQVPGK